MPEPGTEIEAYAIWIDNQKRLVQNPHAGGLASIDRKYMEEFVHPGERVVKVKVTLAENL